MRIDLREPNFRLQTSPLLKGLSTCSPQNYRITGRDVPSCSGACWRWLLDHGCRVDKWSGGRINLFMCGEGRSCCRSKKYHPRVGCMHTAGGLRACTSSMYSFSFLSCILEILKFLIQLNWLWGVLLLLMLFFHFIYYWIPWRPTLNQKLHFTGCC